MYLWFFIAGSPSMCWTRDYIITGSSFSSNTIHLISGKYTHLCQKDTWLKCKFWERYCFSKKPWIHKAVTLGSTKNEEESFILETIRNRWKSCIIFIFLPGLYILILSPCLFNPVLSTWYQIKTVRVLRESC